MAERRMLVQYGERFCDAQWMSLVVMKQRLGMAHCSLCVHSYQLTAKSCCDW